MPQLRVKSGKQKGRVVSLKNVQRLIIGREACCGLQITDQGVSREHAEIFSVGEMVFIRDLESRNGTFVNDGKVTEELLREGDLLRLGNTEISFESSSKSSEQDLHYEDGELLRTSLDLKIDDLYVLDSGAGGRGAALFRAICQAAQIVQSERDEKRLFERLLDLTQENIPADHLYLFLRDESTGSVTPRAMRQKVARPDIVISRSILRRVISDSRAILTEDAMRDDRFKSDDSILVHQIRAVLCVPIRSTSGPARGAIYAVNTSLTETFDQSDLQLVSAIGALLDPALENLLSSRVRRRMFMGALGRLLSLLEGLPPGKPGHGERVSAYATAIARELNLPDREILCAGLAGMLHDVGKLPAVSGISLSASQRSSGLAHILAGLEFLKGLPGFEDVMQAIKGHHEHYDGSGIPGQLKGDAIPLIGSIVAVASKFDKLLQPEPPQTASLSNKPDALPTAAQVKNALTQLDQAAGKDYDPAVVRALIVSHRHGTLYSSVRLEPEPGPSVRAAVAQPPAQAQAPEEIRQVDLEQDLRETARTVKPRAPDAQAPRPANG